MSVFPSLVLGEMIRRWSGPFHGLLATHASRRKAQKAPADGFAPEMAPPSIPGDPEPKETFNVASTLAQRRCAEAAQTRAPSSFVADSVAEPGAPNSPRYFDEHAYRLRTTSVGGGRPLTHPNEVAEDAALCRAEVVGRQIIDESSEQKNQREEREAHRHTRSWGKLTPAEQLAREMRLSEKPSRSSTPAVADETQRPGRSVFEDANATILGMAEIERESTLPLSALSKSSTFRQRLNDTFVAQQENNPFATANLNMKKPTGGHDAVLDQMMADIDKLDYFRDTPFHDSLVQEFNTKYAKELEDLQKKHPPPDESQYSNTEKALGLQGEPISVDHLSPQARMVMASGAQGYHPLNIAEFNRKLSRGYAFPPSMTAGKFNGLSEAVAKELSEKILEDRAKGLVDRHPLNLLLGFNAVHRAQLKVCLSDIDARDSIMIAHTILSYPYAIYLFYIYCGMWFTAVYFIQKKYRAIAFYDEYLGLDISRCPQIEPYIYVAIMWFLTLSMAQYPLKWLTLVTQRAYRIRMGRSIGPP